MDREETISHTVEATRRNPHITQKQLVEKGSCVCVVQKGPVIKRRRR